jgi:hypothetical protein
MKYGLTIFLIILCAGGLFYFKMTNGLTESYSPTYNKIELLTADSRHKIYIKTKNWGLTDDNQITIITTVDNPEFVIDSTNQIIFEGLTPFLYKTSGDTLLIVVGQRVDIPTNLNTRWTIIQKIVDNATMMTLLTDKKYKRV